MDLSFEPLLFLIIENLDIMTHDIVNLTRVNKQIRKAFKPLTHDQVLWKKKLIGNVDCDYSVNWSWFCYQVGNKHRSLFLKELINDNKYEYVNLVYKCVRDMYGRKLTIKGYSKSWLREYHTYMRKLCATMSVETLKEMMNHEGIPHDICGMMYSAAKDNNIKLLTYLHQNANLFSLQNVDENIIFFDNHKILRIAISRGNLEILKYVLKYDRFNEEAIKCKRLRNNCVYKAIRGGMRETLEILKKHNDELVESFTVKIKQ